MYLALNHAWRALCERYFINVRMGGAGRSAAWLLTFVAVVVAWVFFRATTLSGAGTMLSAMAGLQGVALPSAFAPLFGGMTGWLQGIGIEFAPGGGSRFVLTWLWVLGLLLIALILPNTQELMRHHRPGLDFDPGRVAARLQWRATPAWGLTLAVLAAAGVLSLSQATQFLYYQF